MKQPYPGDREHAGLGLCVGENPAPDSKNCKDLPLGGNKRTVRKTRAWMEMEHLFCHAQTQMHMSKEWKGMGGNPYMPPLYLCSLP